MSRHLDPAPIDDLLHRAVHAGQVPHVVAVAADADGIVYQGAAGPRAAGSDVAVGVDSVFRIASMTKLVTTVAALQLAERDKLDLDSPVDTIVSEFATLGVLTGFEGDQPVLRPPASRATVRQLMTHTAGLGYWFFNADLARWQQVTGTPDPLSGDAAAFTAPLVADPGTRFEYGTNVDWLGRVVERIGGQPLDEYVEEHVTGPLGMASTSFHPDATLRGRLVPVHERGAAGANGDGAWAPTDIDLPAQPDSWAGGHGLYSTPRDYLALQRALLRGGELGGVQILREATVAEAFTNQIGALWFPPHIATADPKWSVDVDLGPGLQWGLGLLLTTEPAPGMRAAGSGAWAGIFNTHFWIDRTTGVAAAVYTQLLPFAESGALQVYVDVEAALYAGLRG